jgi:hypothetical protein
VRNPPVRRSAQVDRLPQAAPAGRSVVPGSAIPVLTFKVTDYGSDSREEAEAHLWRRYQDRYPGAFVQIVHADDPSWEIVR